MNWMWVVLGTDWKCFPTENNFRNRTDTYCVDGDYRPPTCIYGCRSISGVGVRKCILERR